MYDIRENGETASLDHAPGLGHGAPAAKGDHPHTKREPGLERKRKIPDQGGSVCDFQGGQQDLEGRESPEGKKAQ